MAATQHCPKCDRDLPFTDFAPRYKNKPHYRHTYCNSCASIYSKERRKNHPEPRTAKSYARTLQEYFDKYVTPADPDICWEWQGSRNNNKYGITCFQRKRQGAHVVAYELYHGFVPEGLLVLHRCDNPPCCNPNHLFLGTYQDNALDAFAKGRRGKVTHEQMREIRRLFIEEKMGVTALSRQLGLPYATCHYIAHHSEYVYLN